MNGAIQDGADAVITPATTRSFFHPTIALHDPARVRREIEAKRRILARHARDPWPCHDLRALASPSVLISPAGCPDPSSRRTASTTLRSGGRAAAPQARGGSPSRFKVQEVTALYEALMERSAYVSTHGYWERFSGPELVAARMQLKPVVQPVTTVAAAPEA
ncbi:DUF6221 family protein [Streptomyces huasconensis]|uniref:DUF6221 family protein n=1 Tax=Streptomyces huasconensis TaxID=1854574 RepID=UPI0036F5EEB3